MFYHSGIQKKENILLSNWPKTCNIYSDLILDSEEKKRPYVFYAASENIWFELKTSVL